MARFTSLEELVNELRDDRNLSQWLVGPDGAVYDSTELVRGPAGEGMRYREAVMLGPRVFVSGPDGLFNFDRSPDFLTVPADLEGEKLVSLAHELAKAIEAADIAQTEFLDATEHVLYAVRRDGGDRTIAMLDMRVEDAKTALTEATDAEREGRKRFRLGFVAREAQDAAA